MLVLWIMLGSIAFLGLGGLAYSRYLARAVGEDNVRPTPANVLADGRDFVASPTSVVFAHHFAAIAGAGPVLGPVIAIVYGWGPALVWVLVGGLFFGAVHDYIATFMAMREGGVSIATVTQRIIGRGAFVALTLFLIVMLVLVCATFLNGSAAALTSMLPHSRLDLPQGQTLFRVASVNGREMVVIGGVATMSVIVITVFAPLVGWMYIKRKVAAWKCAVVAAGVCALSIVVGVYWPVPLPVENAAMWKRVWQVALLVYVTIAAGVPVWLFLQSRDFINAQILYAGLAALLVTLAVAAFKAPAVADALPALNLEQGAAAKGPIWPGMFILIACGAISGFHSLCGGGTTCKQLKSERAARRVGFWAMILETFVAVSVIAVMIVGASRASYLSDVHPLLDGTKGSENPILAFAMAVGNAGRIAWGAPIVVGALAGMLLLEGFLVTTLDAAVRLTRYLIEEIWRVLFGRYDVFAPPVGEEPADGYGLGEQTPLGADGIPISPPLSDSPPAPARPVATRGLFRQLLLCLRHYWVNSALAALLTLLLALSADLNALWQVFGTANQLLAAMVLALAGIWLLRRKRRAFFVFIPAVFMLATTGASLVLLAGNYLADPATNLVLLVTDLALMAIAAYLLVVGARAAIRYYRQPATQPEPEAAGVER